MSKTSVAVEIQGRADLDEIVSVLEAAGAANVAVDRRSGDPYAGVERYFFIEFDDPRGFVGKRHVYGFHTFASDTHENGWTRLQLGADDRGRHFMQSVAETLGGWMKDERTNEEAVFEPARSLAFTM